MTGLGYQKKAPDQVFFGWDSVGILTIESPLHYCSRMFPLINHSTLAFYCVVALRLSYHRLHRNRESIMDGRAGMPLRNAAYIASW